MKEARKLNTMYTIVSFFLSAIFFWATSLNLTQNRIASSSWEFWENIPLIFLALFFLAAGIYGVTIVARDTKQEEGDAPASREIAKMAVLIIILAIAIWIMLHFGFE